FFEPGPGGPGHVAIYVGGGMMIDAPHTGSSVQVEQVWGTPVEIRRILPSESEFTSGGVGSGTIDATDGAGAYGSIPASLGVPDGLVGAFAAAGQQYGVPPSLLAAVAKQESGFDPGAVSSAGAEGLMQIMPGTAAGLGIDPMDPSQAIDGAAQLLSGYLQQYGGSVPLALAAYNAGPGAVSEYGGVPPYSETQAYVQDIMSMLGATG
ncbi:MAG TPA: transglycosylase SLT domain-containing protein, partial [Acidimicrobiales bacterium]|nr:transglycosylase SLT domain-containing protein [Acidimicrobiales bacterium]